MVSGNLFITRFILKISNDLMMQVRCLVDGISYISIAHHNFMFFKTVLY